MERRGMMRTLSLLMVMALLIAACGRSDESSAGADGALTPTIVEFETIEPEPTPLDEETDEDPDQTFTLDLSDVGSGDAPQYVVQVGDGLDAIAVRECGTIESAVTIFEANEGVPQDNGGALTTRSYLEVGWVLDIVCADGQPPSSATTAETEGTEPSTGEATGTYVVRPGDGLVDIAVRECGDAESAVTIFEANEGVPQADGGALKVRSYLEVGWELTIVCAE